jgi:hypothetical protein
VVYDLTLCKRPPVHFDKQGPWQHLHSTALPVHRPQHTGVMRLCKMLHRAGALQQAQVWQQLHSTPTHAHCPFLTLCFPLLLHRAGAQ